MKYYTDGKMVVREDGYIAVQHRTSNPTARKIGGVTYQFSPRLNVSLAWVAGEHADIITGDMARMCCGQTGKKFFFASIINVNLWEHGNRTGETV